jgi:ribosomal protein L29
MKQKDAIKEIKKKAEAELVKDITEYRDRLWSLKRDLAAGKIKNVREIKSIKKSIARALTFITWNRTKGI